MRRATLTFVHSALRSKTDSLGTDLIPRPELSPRQRSARNYAEIFLFQIVRPSVRPSPFTGHPPPAAAASEGGREGTGRRGPAPRPPVALR